MTYNILDGGIGRENHILEVIQAANPDIVLIQEVTDEDVFQSMAHHLNMNYFLGKGNRERRVALLSQFPIENFTSYQPGFPIWHNITEAIIRVPTGGMLRLIGVHLVANPWIGFEVWRLLELRYIIRYLQQYTNEPCLIAGDLNAVAPGDRIITPSWPMRLKFILWSQGNRVYRFAIRFLVASGFVDCFRLKNRNEDGFTLPPPAPSIRLDYIFVNQRLEKHVKSCWVVCQPEGVTKASDHYPVMVELNFEKNREMEI
jgi:endonuclease/exonuclease/phosphatase family metal-dependent hydrolase